MLRYVAWEPMENMLKTQGCALEQLKRKDNTGFACEPMKTQGKHVCCVGNYGKRMITFLLH